MRPVQVFLLSCIEPLPIQAPFPFEHGSEEDHQWKHGEIVENPVLIKKIVAVFVIQLKTIHSVVRDSTDITDNNFPAIQLDPTSFEKFVSFSQARFAPPTDLPPRFFQR